MRAELQLRPAGSYAGIERHSSPSIDWMTHSPSVLRRMTSTLWPWSRLPLASFLAAKIAAIWSGNGLDRLAQ